MRSLLIFIILYFVGSSATFCQDSTSLYNKSLRLSDRLFASADRKTDLIERRITRSTMRYLEKLHRSETKMKRMLARKDSIGADHIFADVDGNYDSLRNIISNRDGEYPSSYDAHLDSVKSSIDFLKLSKVTKLTPSNATQMSSLSAKYTAMQSTLNRTDFIQQQLNKRELDLKNKLSNLGLAKDFKKYRQQADEYRSQLNEYRTVLKNPQKLEKILLDLANSIPSFKKFFNQHSLLGSLFRLPAAEEELAVPLAGLQTRTMIDQAVQQQLGAALNPQGMISNGLTSGESNINGILKKINLTGGKSSEVEMPDFKPNPEKSKTFLKRLELGTNIQTTKSNIFFPVTTDIGVSIGYKLSPKAVAGIGVNYKMGLGSDFRHIDITHQGIGLRTFVDIKIKGGFWLTGGGERNFRNAFEDFAQLKNVDHWQSSALVGVSKKYQITKKMKGNMQLLYDFLHARQLPAGQPVVFRMGYIFK